MNDFNLLWVTFKHVRDIPGYDILDTKRKILLCNSTIALSHNNEKLRIIGVYHCIQTVGHNYIFQWRNIYIT